MSGACRAGQVSRSEFKLEEILRTGLVEIPVTLSYQELRALPNVDVPADMHCVTGWTTLDNSWHGVAFRTLLELAKPTSEAKWVIAHCEYGYTSNLSIEAMDDDDVLVAWANGGQDLEPEHGWPLRLVHDHGLHLTVKFFGEVLRQAEPDVDRRPVVHVGG